MTYVILLKNTKIYIIDFEQIKNYLKIFKASL